MNHRIATGDPLPTDVAVADGLAEIATGVVAARGVWVKTAGTLNFIDGEGVSQSLDSGYFTAGVQYGIRIAEILAGTTLVGKLLK